MVKLLTGLAPAKINLFLRVVRRRPDGYHELDSIFLPISLSDTLRIEIRKAPANRVALRCNWPALPAGARNLAARAALSFLAEFGLTAHVTIDLHKEIPAGAGLGGGSSDAGTVLRMMAELSRIDATERLGRIALALGADVSFFLDPRPARVGGIGERITPLKKIPEFDLVIAVPPVEVATARVYALLRPEQWSGPASAGEIEALCNGRVSSRLVVNDLSAAALALCPEIGVLKAILEDLGARAAAMTGSGGAVFGVFADHEVAARAAVETARRAPKARIVVTRSVATGRGAEERLA